MNALTSQLSSAGRVGASFASVCMCVAACMLALACPGPIMAQSAGTGVRPVETPANIDAWRARRFGMFIHWGPVSLKGTEIGWSRGKQVPIAEYDRLYEKFDPTQFDADAWVRVAVQAGMKYLVITTKHHDGFCLWPSKHTTYHIGNSPFGRDVLRELADASRKQGIAFGAYYSVCDWHHPKFPLGSPGGRTRKPHPDLDGYLLYVRNQITELIENYGPLSTLWFDVPQGVDSTRGRPIVALARRLQPGIVLNNRAYRDGKNPVGDYDTPEQRIGGFQRRRGWETCMTICHQWAWKPGDKMKSLAQCIRTLLRTVGGDGNLLLNVGPMPDGRIEPRQVARLLEVGAWLKTHGGGIYGTRGGPFKPGKWGVSTCRGKRIHLFVMDWPRKGPLLLPAPRAKIIEASVGGARLTVEQTDTHLSIVVPAALRDAIATEILLTVEKGMAFDIEPIDVLYHSGSLGFRRRASASNVFHGDEKFAPGMALDDDDTTRWATDAGTHTAWLEVDFGKSTTIGRVRIDESAQFARVRSFELQYQEGKSWRTMYRGKTIGPNWSTTVTPVRTRRVRLNILEAVEGPTLNEFQLFPPTGG